MRQSDWCEIHTLLRRSDWCEQHTTLHANIEFFYLVKKIVSKMVPNDDEPDKSKRQG